MIDVSTDILVNTVYLHIKSTGGEGIQDIYIDNRCCTGLFISLHTVDQH